MIAHLTAIQSALAGEGWDVFLLDATGATWPYIIVAPGYSVAGERPVADALTTVEGDVRVTVAGETADSALGLAGAVRALLSPGLTWAPVTVTGRAAWLRWLRTEMTEVDRDVTIPGSNRHPIYTVDTYHLISQPAA